MKLLLYCTKEKPYLIGGYHTPYYLDKGGKKSVMDDRDDILNGKVVAGCDFELEEIFNVGDEYEGLQLYTETLSIEEILKKSCLSYKDYLVYVLSTENYGYAIHIKNLKIFDEPRELNDFVLLNKYREDLKGTQYNVLTKAPQNMCKVAYSKNCINKYNFNDIYKGECVLISIRPEWLCKILNGEKTIEVRKKVLKEMKD